MPVHQLEIACFNVQSALIAEQGGADRIELCDNMQAGGITPGFMDVQFVKQNVKIPVFVMIRPRGGNFVYADSEFQQMKQSIVELKALGVDGFVFGCLNEKDEFHPTQNAELLELAHPLPCTFHRAIDTSVNPLLMLEQIIACGFKTILSSGTAKTAEAGTDILKEMIIQAKSRIGIMPGGGVRSSNIQLLKSVLPVIYFHSSAVKENDIADLNEIKLLKLNLS